MTAATETGSAVQVYRVFIKATAQAVWDAITSPGWATKYGYACPVEYDLRPGGSFRALANDAMRAHGTPAVIIVGEVIEADAPRKLVQTWHPIWDPQSEKERPTRLTYEIDEEPGGYSRLTLTHDVEGAPSVAAMVSGSVPNAGGGWSFVLSDLKTLLETGSNLAG
jgi:uncharacterized protein YndB with AHSA1/START domain